jgi:O-antigen ligase
MKTSDSPADQRVAPVYRVTLACSVICAALAPAYVDRWRIIWFPTTPLELAIVVTLLAFTVETWRARQTLSWRSPLTVPTAVFLVAGVISIFVAPSRLAALGIFRAYLLEPILMALVLLTVVRTTSQVLAIIGGFCVGATVLGIADAATVLVAFKTQTFGNAGEAPVAIYNTTNAIALYLVPLIAVAGSYALFGRRGRVRIALAIFTAIAAIATVLTLSRGGWVTLAVVAGVLAVSHRQRWLWLAGLVAAGLSLALIPVIRLRIAAEFGSTGVGLLSGRPELWANSLKMLEQTPVFGAGLSGFKHQMAVAVPGYQLLVMYPHNIVLNFWSETGLLGLISFGAIIVIAMTVSWRGSRFGAAEWRPIHLGVLLALVAVLVHGLVDVPILKNDLAFEFWALIALTMAGAREARTTGAPDHKH